MKAFHCDLRSSNLVFPWISAWIQNIRQTPAPNFWTPEVRGSSSCSLHVLEKFHTSVQTVSKQANVWTVYSQLFSSCVLTLISAPPVSLRVSSLTVVRSDHSSVCVSWRPVSAVDGYRLVIQSVKGSKGVRVRRHKPPWAPAHRCVSVCVCRQRNQRGNCRRIQQQLLFHWPASRDSVSHQPALSAGLGRGRRRLHSPPNRSAGQQIQFWHFLLESP